jgi:SanA protein
MRRLIRTIWRYRGRLLGCLAVALTLSVPALNLWILRSSESRVFTDEGGLPENDVGLVLGVSRFGNPHFKTRTEAAALLYHMGKVKHLLS